MITRIRLENFKSFWEAECDLSPLTLILGVNGAGKSNLFDALRFLKFMGEGVTIRDAIQGHASQIPTGTSVPGIRGGAKEIVRFGTSPRDFTLEVSIRRDLQDFQYRIGVNVDKFRVVSEELRASNVNKGSYVFSTHPDPNPLSQDHESPTIAARFYKRARGSNPKRMFNPGVSILSQFQGRQAESRVNENAAQIVREELQSITPLELRPEVLREYSPSGAIELGEHGENFPSVVFNLEQEVELGQFLTAGNEERPDEPRGLRQAVRAAERRMDAIRSWLGELTPRPITRITTESAPTGERIFGVVEGVDGPVVSARSLSDGTLRFAALAFAALASDKRRSLVIEELENGINPTRLDLVVRMLESVAEEGNSLQVIASTHSPTILSLASKRIVFDSIAVGWDSENQCSRLVAIRDIEDVEEVLNEIPLGELQAEGWLDVAVSR